MGVALAQAIIGAVVLTVVFGLLTSVGVKLFGRSIPYATALLISLKAQALATLLFVVYYAVKFPMGIPSSVDFIAILAGMSLAGTAITRQAGQYGIKKAGWFGIGAKSILLLFVLAWVITGLIYAGMKIVG